MAPLPCILRDERGSMAIETAFVAPILLVLALGGFEVSTMVARQTELQSAAAEAATVVRAVAPETAEEQNTIRDIVATSVCGNTTPTVAEDGKSTCNSATVGVVPLYRCGTATNYSTTNGGCGSDVQYEFIRVDISDKYAPVWTKFGVTSGFDYNISRTVQIG
ncbi:MAG: TadE/TadG family type IV pilus assembly protein [Alteraurantiacibacter sp.]